MFRWTESMKETFFYTDVRTKRYLYFFFVVASAQWLPANCATHGGTNVELQKHAIFMIPELESDAWVPYISFKLEGRRIDRQSYCRCPRAPHPLCYTVKAPRAFLYTIPAGATDFELVRFQSNRQRGQTIEVEGGVKAGTVMILDITEDNPFEKTVQMVMVPGFEDDPAMLVEVVLLKESEGDVTYKTGETESTLRLRNPQNVEAPYCVFALPKDDPLKSVTIRYRLLRLCSMRKKILEIPISPSPVVSRIVVFEDRKQYQLD